MSEKTLQESIEIFRSLADKNPGIIFRLEFQKKKGFLPVYVCERVTDLVGLTLNQIRKDPLTLLELVDESEKRKIARILNQASQSSRTLSFDTEIKTRQGPRWYQVQLLPFSSGGGGLVVNGVAVDITGQKQAQFDLQEAKTLLVKTLDSIEEAVFVIGPEYRQIVTVCNAAVETIFGYKPEELAGLTTEKIHLSPEMYKHFGEISEPELKKTGKFETEYKMKRKDGSIIDTYNTVSALDKSKGWMGGVVSTVRDITFQKTATRELENREKELKKKTERLEELNTALRVLLEKREQDKKYLEKGVSESVNGLILPYLKKIRETGLSELQTKYVDDLESSLNEIVKFDDHRVSSELMQLSPTETTIANLVKQGYRVKEIAARLNTSPRTVEFHRDNIRKKLNIKGRKINLRTFLLNIS